MRSDDNTKKGIFSSGTLFTLITVANAIEKHIIVKKIKVQEKQIIEYIMQHPSMNAYYRPLGHWSIEIAVFVKHPGELRRIILDLRNKYGSIMKVHDTILVYEEPKSNYLPPGVFDVSDKEK